MTDTALKKARNTYLVEMERDQQRKALESQVKQNEEKLKNIQKAIIANLLRSLNTRNYQKMDTSQEYNEAVIKLGNEEDELEKIEESVRYDGYYNATEQDATLASITAAKNRISLLQEKLDKQAKRENLQLFC